MHLLTRLVLCTFAVQWSFCWNNDWDGELNFRCASHQFVSHVRSEHSNTHEDRRFELSCRNVAWGDYGSWCEHSGAVNDYDQMVEYRCSGQGYISGMQSVHDNGPEDRRWSFWCCWMHGISLSGCYYTGWTNEWDGLQNYRVPDGFAMHGWYSVHDNGYEDRLFNYIICKVN